MMSQLACCDALSLQKPGQMLHNLGRHDRLDDLLALFALEQAIVAQNGQQVAGQLLRVSCVHVPISGWVGVMSSR